MKNFVVYPALAAMVTALALVPGQTRADTFLDASGEGSIVTSWPHLDILSVEVNNTATDLIFKFNLAGNPVVTDWGKYMVAINSTAGGDSAGNGWNRPISMAGMDYWLGTWVDFGNGSENRNWTGAAWNLQSATYNPNPDVLVVGKDASSVTLSLKLSGLGLSAGNAFIFDVFTSGGGGTDSAIDALANPGQTVNDWGVAYNSQSTLVYTVAAVPEPSTLAFLGLAGGLMLRGLFRRR